MKLKIDDSGHAVLSDGKPIYVHGDGREIVFDGAQAFAKIGQLTGENTDYKKRFTEAESRLKAFEGIEDPSAAIKALETIKNVDEGKLVAAGKVEEIKAAAARAAQEQVAAAAKASAQREQELSALLEKRTAELNDHMIGGGFSSSKFIAEKLAIPAELARAYFGKNIKIEDGAIVPYDNSGNKIYSPTRPGEIANFDEGVEALVLSCPFRDQILKGSGASGSGATTSTTNANGKKSVNRTQFDAMSPADRMAHAKAGGIVTD
jgi:hypothetical protein